MQRSPRDGGGGATSSAATSSSPAATPKSCCSSLPPIVHIRKESDKAAMRWSLERMKEELRDPQPGGSLIAQQLAYMMLVQALRLHLADARKAASAGSSRLPTSR